MKLTNRQLLESVDALRALNNQKLPVKVSFKIAKNSRVLNETLKDYTETLKGLQKDHAEKDDDDEVKTENDRIVMKDQKGFNKAYEELLDIENDVTIKPVALDELKDFEVEPAVLLPLDWLIVD